MLELFKVAGTSLLSLLVLFLLCRLSGQRQISQLSMFDYINSITIGSIAAELATDLDRWPHALTAMLIYGLCTALIAHLSCVTEEDSALGKTAVTAAGSGEACTSQILCSMEKQQYLDAFRFMLTRLSDPDPSLLSV